LLKSKSVVGVTESKAIHHEHLTHPKKSRWSDLRESF
jgi:hypothetical protein